MSTDRNIIINTRLQDKPKCDNPNQTSAPTKSSADSSRTIATSGWSESYGAGASRVESSINRGRTRQLEGGWGRIGNRRTNDHPHTPDLPRPTPITPNKTRLAPGSWTGTTAWIQAQNRCPSHSLFSLSKTCRNFYSCTQSSHILERMTSAAKRLLTALSVFCLMVYRLYPSFL